MNCKTWKKLLAVLLTLATVLSMSMAAFATSGSVTLTKVETTIPVILSSSATGFDATGHTYAAVKIMDLYKVVEADGFDAKDANGKPVYQYKLVLTPALAADATAFTNLLAGAGFTFDSKTGEITKADGTAIASQAGQNENSSDAAKLAALIAQYVVTNNIEETSITPGTAKSLASGYWVIYETSNAKNDGTVATKPILLDLRPTDASGNTVTQRAITLKDATVTLDKKVVSGETKSDEGTVAIGDTVNYEIDTNFPTYEANADKAFQTGYPKFELKDTFSAGLDYVYTDNVTDGVTVKIDGATVTSGYTVTYSNRVLTITFTSAAILANQGKSVTVTYAATVNEKAVVNKEGGNDNTVKLTYSNNPEKADDVKTLEDKVPVYTFAFDLKKLDGADDSQLADAKFQMKNGNDVLYFTVSNDKMTYTLADEDTDGATAVIETVSAGDITFKGLDAGTYTLTETEAPTGYAKLANVVTVKAEAVKAGEAGKETLTGAAKVTVTNATAVTDTTGDTEGGDKTTGTTGVSDVNVVVRNFKGISLPETGSVTSIIVMAAGALVVLVGVAYLLRGRKKDDEA